MTIKVMTVVGTRPELIKLSRVIAELDVRVKHVLVHTGQNYDYELNGIFFEQLGIRKPDHFLDAAAAEPAAAIGQIIARSDAVMKSEQPDAVLVLGDTNSCLAVISAKRRKIPIFHMEAGNRCFDQRVPEEINRKIVDHVSDINLPYTEHARRYLLAEGIRPDTIIKTGSPMKEILDHHAPGIAASTILDTLKLESGKYFLVSAHREENVDDPGNLAGFLSCLQALWNHHRLPVIVSTHPRTRSRIDAAGGFSADGDIRFMKPVGFLDYIKLQMHARCVVSDSGTITEEASILGLPAITIRNAHERPEGMDEGTLIMSGLDPERVLLAIDTVTAQKSGQGPGLRTVPDYLTDNVSRKVVRIILSYTDFVNRGVWHKPG